LIWVVVRAPVKDGILPGPLLMLPVMLVADSVLKDVGRVAP
jgi:hypothetical protein